MRLPSRNWNGHEEAQEAQKSGNEVFVLVNRSLRLLFFFEKLSFACKRVLFGG
jgi:hypothetical protein